MNPWLILAAVGEEGLVIGAAAAAVLQMGAAEVPMQVVVGAEGSKAAAACMGGGFRNLSANIPPSEYTFRFRIVH